MPSFMPKKHDPLHLVGLGANPISTVGTFTGYSSICIASALPEDGRLVCCDDSERWTTMARKYWQRAGLEDRIELRLQTAESTLRQLLDGDHAETFDFIFIDADKQNYPQYYEACMRLLRRGGLLAVDNTLWSGSVADLDNMEPDTCAIRRFNNMVKQDDRVIKSLVPIGDGLTLVYKLC